MTDSELSVPEMHRTNPTVNEPQALLHRGQTGHTAYSGPVTRRAPSSRLRVLQQVQKPWLHTVLPRRLAFPACIAVLRPHVRFFSQHLGRVPSHCFVGLLCRIATWVQSEDIQLPMSRKCRASRIEHYPQFMLQIQWDVLGKILDHGSVLTWLNRTRLQHSSRLAIQHRR